MIKVFSLCVLSPALCGTGKKKPNHDSEDAHVDENKIEVRESYYIRSQKRVGKKLFESDIEIGKVGEIC